MSACYSCHTILNKKTRSFEHIIPNSIGGVLKSNRLICRACNEAFGATIDVALAKHFESLVASLNIIPDRINPGLRNAANSPMMHEHWDPDLVLRAVAKIAVNYYLMKTRGVHYLRTIIDIVNGVIRNQGHIINMPVTAEETAGKEHFHTIAIKGDASTRQLEAHIVLFGAFAYTVKLCADYNGEEIEYFYKQEILNKTII